MLCLELPEVEEHHVSDNFLTPGSDLCSFTTEGMDPETTMIYAYYKEGTSSPTFLYPLYALKEEKC